VLVCIAVVDVDALETGVVDQVAPCGVREDAEEVVVVLDTQRLSRFRQPVASHGKRLRSFTRLSRRCAPALCRPLPRVSPDPFHARSTPGPDLDVPTIIAVSIPPDTVFSVPGYGGDNLQVCALSVIMNRE
jgi:hypothetical protein